ncbi:MAG: glycosyltransferase [Jannaschia sp.]
MQADAQFQKAFCDILMKDAVIIIPHRDDSLRLLRCLAVLQPGLPEGVGVVVVDNGSAEDVAGLLAEAHPEVRVLREARPGAAMARNAGVAATSEERLIFLDADCVPEPGWLAAALAEGSRADLVGGAVSVFDEPPIGTGAQGFEQVFAFDNRAYVAMGFSVTANLTTTRRVFDAVGPFRAAVSEDKEWCLRARAAGFSIAYAADMLVAHPSRGDWSALARKWRRLTEEGYALHRAQGRGPLRWAIRALAMPISALVHTPRVLLSDRLQGPRQRAATLATLWRLRCTRMFWMLGQLLSRAS